MSEKVICKHCVYDSETPGVSFDDNGVCNYCKMNDEIQAQYQTGRPEGLAKFQEIVDEIKRNGKNKKYDCVIGVSGGADSSYLLVKAKEYGLRPLAVHYDNTWNSTIATENITNVLKKLNIDLFTHVVDNKEIDDIYRSFMKSGVPEIDSATDIGLAATLYRAAAKFGVKYVIEGHSYKTEGIAPLGWAYTDGKYIAGIQKKFGTMKIKTFPNMSFFNFIRWTAFMRIRKIRPLWYINYQKEEAKAFLAKEYDWKWYGGHHLENRFNAFGHSYYLPNKFKMDQRKNGYSAHVRSGQMTRDEALKLLTEPPYLEPELLDYLKKRLGFSEQEFADIINGPNKSYKDYKTYKKRFERLRPLFWILYRAKLVPHSFYIKYCHKQK